MMRNLLDDPRVQSLLESGRRRRNTATAVAHYEALAAEAADKTGVDPGSDLMGEGPRRAPHSRLASPPVDASTPASLAA